MKPTTAARGTLVLCAAACVAAGAPSAASALTFNITTAPGDTLTPGQSAAFVTAAAAWSTILTDNITVNLQVGFSTTLGSGILGATQLSFATISTAGAITALANDASSGKDVAAVTSLLALAPSNTTLSVTSAQAKALGYSSTGVDAIIQFSSNFSFATTRNADGSTPAGSYDLIGVAEHEIAHALGFVSSIDFGGAPTLLDEYRFTAQNVRATASGTAYFSLDDGATSLASFSPGGSGQYQASHWLLGTGSLMDPAVAAGVSENITALDIAALDVVGYNVPEPATLAMLCANLFGWFSLVGLRLRGGRWRPARPAIG